jgi:hypothetical protein
VTIGTLESFLRFHAEGQHRNNSPTRERVPERLILRWISVNLDSRFSEGFVASLSLWGNPKRPGTSKSCEFSDSIVTWLNYFHYTMFERGALVDDHVNNVRTTCQRSPKVPLPGMLMFTSRGRIGVMEMCAPIWSGCFALLAFGTPSPKTK